MSTNQSQETIRRQIVSDVSVKVLINHILEMPDRIKEAKDTQTDTEFRVSNNNVVKIAQEELEVLEGELFFEIRQQVSKDTGKLLYTNEDQRKQALRIACSKNGDWRDAVEKLKVAEHALAVEKVSLAKCHNTLSWLNEQYKGQLAIAYLIGGLSREDGAQEHLNIITRQADALNDIGASINKLNQIEVTNNA